MGSFDDKMKELGVYYPPDKPQDQLYELALDRGQKGKPYASPTNFVTVLMNDDAIKGKLAFDTFTQSEIYRGPLPWKRADDVYGEWQDRDDDALACYIDDKYHFHSKNVMKIALRSVQQRNEFDSLIDRLEMLPEWDGEDRICNLLPLFLGADQTAYTAEVMNLVMQGALMRAYHPGCKMDYMPVLIGAQGIGKSVFSRMLALNEQFFDDNFNTFEGDKARERLRGKWILEVGELLALKRAKDVEGVKAFLTGQIDTYRSPYDRLTHNAPRRCVFIATTNSQTFLTDKTGNRRYLPILCHAKAPNDEMCNTEKGREYIEQAWAEAMHYFKEENMDTKLVLPEYVKEEALRHQIDAVEDDSRVGIIEEYLKRKRFGEYTCVAELWAEALGFDPQVMKQYDSRAIGQIMDDLDGWIRDGRQYTANYGRQRTWKKCTD